MGVAAPHPCQPRYDARIASFHSVSPFLSAGNCRWTLSGHTAPVDYLRLDAQGGTFLSADSKCRDRSLRLWDLNKGTDGRLWQS